MQTFVAGKVVFDRGIGHKKAHKAQNSFLFFCAFVPLTIYKFHMDKLRSKVGPPEGKYGYGAKNSALQTCARFAATDADEITIKICRS